MPLSAGTRLGPYDIRSAIGEGGMGEVYRARDTRLDRDVAVKVLPAGASSDPERLRRFEQEARATAALNHPNIVSVHDVGTDQGVSYVVSELLEGETLRDRLKAGPLPPRKVVEWGAQIARGLSAAHEKGIVHRDLKPENLFVTRDGTVKILDFGIAKLVDAGLAQGQTAMPTAAAGTTPGLVLGTVGYMSPEQVRGLQTDARTDIFSLGAILYEMLAGRRAFGGATQADAMSAILSADPPEMSETGAHAPPSLERIVRRCLEKSPDERFQSARDVAFSIDAIGTATHGTGGQPSVPAPPPRPRWSAAGLAAAIAAGMAIGGTAVWLAPARTAPETSTEFRQLTFRRGTIASARFSPDGETIVYSSAWEGRPHELFSTRVGAIGERPLGIQGVLQAISKAGEMAVLVNIASLGNWMEAGTLARAPLGGGAPREIVRDVGGADWSPDGQQLVITRFVPATRRWRLEYPIGKVIHETDKWIERPRLSPDGARILLLEHPISGDNRGFVVMVTLQGERTVLTPEYPSLVGGAWNLQTGEAWFTASIGGTRLELLGVTPGKAVRQIAPAPASIVVEDTRPDGRVLLQTTSIKARMLVKTPVDAEERDLSWFDYPLLRDLSPDGRLILFDEEGEGGGSNYSVFVRRTDGSPAVRIADGYAVRLSPDQQWALTSHPGRPQGEYTIVPIGPGEARTFAVPLQQFLGLARWWPDGTRLVLIGSEAGRPPRTFEFTIESGALRPLTPEGVVGTSISPDGTRLVVTDAAGKRLLWPLGGGAPQEIRGIATQDAVAGWSGDGTALFVSAIVPGRGRDIARLDLATGRRQLITTFGPTDPAGVRGIGAPLVSADGRTFAYRYNQLLSDLFVGSGLR